MNASDRTKNSSDNDRSVAMQRLCSECFDMLHKSMVEIAKMRSSIDRIRFRLDRSRDAVLASKELLDRLQLEEGL